MNSWRQVETCDKDGDIRQTELCTDIEIFMILRRRSLYFPKGEVVGAPKLNAPGTVAWAN